MASAGRIHNPNSNKELLALLERNGLTLPEGAEEDVGLYDEEGRLVGCGFLKGNMFQGVALDPERQGEGLSATLVTELIQRAVARGYTSWQVITKPDMARFFLGLGFRRVADASPYAAFLEGGSAKVSGSMEELRALARDRPAPRACVVMNANPFTLGHRALVQRAASENPWVWVLVVQEDRSEFPFEDRLRLVRLGLQDLSNVQVLPGGEYVISARTFPAYFTRAESLASAQGALDAAVFRDVIAPALGVTRRYVGTEPLSPTTARYNEALMEYLPPGGVELIIMERLCERGTPVSASQVRRLLQEGAWDEVRALVPASSYEYLRKAAAAP